MNNVFVESEHFSLYLSLRYHTIGKGGEDQVLTALSYCLCSLCQRDCPGFRSAIGSPVVANELILFIH